MKDLDKLLKESFEGGDQFACQFNKVANMLSRDYGISGPHLVLIVRDILVRVSNGENILKEDDRK